MPSKELGGYDDRAFRVQDRNERVPGDIFSIAEMPTKETLEEFLRGLAGKSTVFFDTRTGTFRRNGRLQ